MRKIIALAMISLDGVIQAPGGPEEDTSDGFKYGGWSAVFNDEVLGKLVKKFMQPSDLLLGRKTFEIFASYWPEHAHIWPGITDVAKYVLSTTLKPSDELVKGWKNSVVLRSLSDIEKLKSGKQSEGDIKIWGSSKLVQSLLAHDLVDELWLQIHPLILGKGKKLFNDNVLPSSWTITESTSTPSGVIVACYKRAGEVKTGTIGA